MTFPGVYKDNFLCHWDEFSKARTPIIAAVNGYAVSVRKKIIISSKNVFFSFFFCIFTVRNSSCGKVMFS